MPADIFINVSLCFLPRSSSAALVVAAAGAVVNFDIPHDPEDYVHRIGRTARGTNGEGLAITFISTEEQFQFKRIEEFLDKEIYKIPVDPKFGETPLYEPEKYSNMRRGECRN